jgi:uncharacterized membrane protein
MLWLILSILTALFQSLKDVFSKIGLKSVDEYITSFALSFFTVIFLSPFLFYTKIPPIKNIFWLALLVNGILNVLASIFYMKAIKTSDLSLSAPMLTFTPLFLLLTSPIMVGEFPKLLNIVGIVLIVIGSYVLNIQESHKGFFAPLKAILHQKGPRFMLCVALIFSLTSNLDKIGVQSSSPLFWGISVNVFICITILPIIIYKIKKYKYNISDFVKLFPLGFFNGLTLLCQLSALKLTLVTYVISIKRTSALMCVFWGYLIFKEKGLKERALGAIIMIIGVFFIALS